MPAAGIEWSWPILITSAGATQIIEPKAQLIVRPDQTGFGTLPNNDSQSLVFDASDLFKINKYSGYDDIESGTRLNIGLVYNATLASGATVDGTFGQSIQLAGQNPYSMPDLAGVGPYSGLATDSSDYVADLSIDSGVGPRFTASSRFDQSTFAVNRWELEATTALGPVTASTAYLYLRQNPYSGTGDPTSVVRSAASVNLAPSWRAFGSLTYDIANSALAADSFGVAFDSDCLTFSLAYSETRKNYTDIAPDRWVGLRLELRTLGEAGVNANLSKLTD